MFSLGRVAWLYLSMKGNVSMNENLSVYDWLLYLFLANVEAIMAIRETNHSKWLPVTVLPEVRVT